MDLSFAIRLGSGKVIYSVNQTTKKTAPQEAMDQLGHSLMYIIHVFAEADGDTKIIMDKWDTKDGCWRLDCQEGEERNFYYVLPQPEGQPTKIVVPISLQIGWIELPPFFCVVSKMGRNVAAQYTETPVGSLPTHKLAKYITSNED